MRQLIIFVVVLYTSNAFSQPLQINIDSLKKALVTEKTDSTTISKSIKKIETLYVSTVEPLHIIYEWCFDKSKKLKNEFLEAYAHMAIGFGHYYTDDSPEEAVSHFTDALKIAEKNNYYDILAQTYNGIAHFYRLGKQTAQFEEFTLKSIEASKKINLLEGIANGYTSLAASTFEKDKNNPSNIEKAIHYQRMANTAGETSGDSTSLIIYYINTSNYLSKAGFFDSAFFYLEKSKSLIDAARRGNDNMSYYYGKGLVSYGMGKYDKALTDYREALSYAKKYEKPSFISRIHNELYRTYKAKGGYANALTFLQLHRVYKDSALTAENFAHATDIQNKFQREKKEVELLQKDLALTKESTKKSKLNLLLFTSLLVLFLSAILAAVLLKNIRRRKKAYHDLEFRNEEIKEQALQLSRQAKLIAKFQSQMNPHFTFNALHSIHELVIANENEKATQQIQSLASLMRQTLINSVKEEITLEEEIKYLQRYIDFEKATSPVNFEFEIKVSPGLNDAVIPPMMLQPLIENAVKHAELGKTNNPFVNVLIEKENDLLKLIVQDNGKGLQTEASNLQQLSHSISILKSRIELLFQQNNSRFNGKNFEIISIPQIKNGTIVQFYIPLNYSF